MTDRIARRPLTALAGALLALVLAPSIASACEGPSLGLSKAAAGAGETVPYSISNVQPGAQYTLTIDGRHQVASGTSSTANGHSGTFRMPDLGASGPASVVLDVTHVAPEQAGHHNGLQDPDTEIIHFTTPVRADAPVSERVTVEGPAPAVQPAGQAQPAAVAAPPARVSGGRDLQPSRTAGTRNPQRAPASRSQARRDATQSAKRTSAVAAAASAHAIATPTRTVPASAAAPAKRSVPTKATRGGRASAGITPPAAAALPATPEPALPAAQSDPVADPEPRERPGALLVAGLALLLGLLGHAGFAAVRLRRTVPMPSAVVWSEAQACDVEAELQQMLALETRDPVAERERSEIVTANSAEAATRVSSG